MHCPKPCSRKYLLYSYGECCQPTLSTGNFFNVLSQLQRSLSPKVILFLGTYIELGGNVNIWALAIHAGLCKGQSLLHISLPMQLWLSDLNHSDHFFCPTPLYSFLLNPWWSLKHIFHPKLCFPLASGRPNQWQFFLAVVWESNRRWSWELITGGGWSSDSHWHKVVIPLLKLFWLKRMHRSTQCVSVSYIRW